MVTTTQSVLQHHLQAFAGLDISDLLSDYAEEAIFITPNGTFHGVDEIAQAYTALLESLPDGVFEAFKLNHMEATGEVASLLWESPPWFPFATDTLIVRDRKIALQTLLPILLRNKLNGCKFLVCP